jgi:hypothetical protein
MLEQELRGEPYNKTASRVALLTRLNDRSEGAVERKHQNISAVLIELGFSYVRGYKPLSNYQALLYEVVRDRVEHAPALLELMRRRAEEPLAVPPQLTDLLSRVRQRPDPPAKTERRTIVADRAQKPPARNYLEIEARNRAVGLAGEELTLQYEHERLWRAGKKDLAERIEHVSQTRGDWEGYDVRSYEESGRERLIEVKTTSFGEHTPLFISRRELDVSYVHAAHYCLYRWYDFRDDPKLFIVPGDVAKSFSIQPVQFLARLS